MEDRPDLDIGAIKEALERERDEIIAIREAHADESRPVTLDQQSVGRLSRMDAMQVQAMAKEVGARRQARLRNIEAALRRIDEGEYGTCLTCGDDIPEKRLTVDLTIRNCIGCAG